MSLVFYVQCALGALAALLAYCLFLRGRRPRQRTEGAVFVTGCDTGMGECIAFALAERGYDVFAGVYLPAESSRKFEQWRPRGGGTQRIVPLALDVSKQETIVAAERAVRDALEQRGGAGAAHARGRLSGVVQCAGIACIGPAELLPVDTFRVQMDVNFIGYVAVAQAFLPLLKQAAAAPGARRGRLAFVGTGGGLPATSTPLLAAYMASKWAGEAYAQSLRMELRLLGERVDVTHINPGFVKPTKLIENGLGNLRRLMADVPVVRERYSAMVDAFVRFVVEQPGVHVREIGKAALELMAAGHVPQRYRVGFESKMTPLVGVLPTGAREWLLRNTLYMHYADAPRVSF